METGRPTDPLPNGPLGGPPVEGRLAADGGSRLACRVCGDVLTVGGAGWAARFNAFLAEHAHPEAPGR
jgi:hypothetical protein